MKKITKHLNLIIASMLFTGFIGMAQKTTEPANSKNLKETEMKTYVIEREIPNAGKLTAVELKGISQTSCTVLKEMGPDIQWIHSYVTGNKIYCIYKAKNKEMILDHARKGGFPANSINEVATVISPETAN
ncbi:MAG: DUF4242 domain-containing protein [Chitinophagaceae bacterium]